MEILKRVVNNKTRMVYYLIVYTVLLVIFFKKNVGPPHQQNLDPPLYLGYNPALMRPKQVTPTPHCHVEIATTT